MLFSLIVATYGRFKEVDTLLHSLAKQDIGLHNFETIIIDQNESDDLSEIVERHSKALDIKHIKSSKKGLSYNRNKGILLARGDYVCFPDDDCTYYSDTLSRAYTHLKTKGVSVAFGSIRDRATGENIIRKWPRKNITLNRYNFFSLYSSITIFLRKNNLLFNENLGVGCYFGSCEDSDYVYRTIKEIGACYYFSDIEVWHPKAGIEHFSEAKNHSYGLGFGAFCAIHKRDPFILRIFLLSTTYHFSLSVYSLLKGNIKGAQKRWQAAKSRITGFIEYSKK